MSRHGYSDDGDCDDNLAQGRWSARLKSATRGKRGQAFFRALVEALDEMPEKSLVANSLETNEGAVCAFGALARHRKVDVKALDIGNTEFPDEDWEDHDWDKLAEAFDVAPTLAREVMYTNDEAWLGKGNENPSFARWAQVRAWAVRQIIPTEAELAATSEAATDA